MEKSLKEIAVFVNGDFSGNEKTVIKDVAPFESAEKGHITFASDPKLLKKIDETCASVIIVPSDFFCDGKNLVQVSNPKLAFFRIVELFYPPEKSDFQISSGSHIGNNFIYGKNISIAPGAVVMNNITMGDNVVIHPNAVIESNVTIGDNVTVYPNVSVMNGTVIGSRVIIHAGTVIGSDGFGFVKDQQKYHKIPHTGIVQIEDDVEIGALNAIDRATFGKTLIKSGVKTDNLVHIAHNVTVGKNTLLVAQVGIAGSASIGDQVIIAGQTGIAGHISIGDNAIIGPKSGVAQSVKPGKVLSGIPAIPHRLWLKTRNIVKNLPEIKKRVKDLEKSIAAIKKTLNINELP